MFFPIIKSKTQENYACVQTISLMSKALNSCGFKKIKTVFNLQVVPPPSQVFHSTKRSFISKYQFVGVMATVLLLASCQKEDISNQVLNSTTSGDMSAVASSSLPKVEAGDGLQVVYSSKTSATLKGSGSSNNGSVTFRWKQTDGNSNATIADPTKPSTAVTNLKPGIYNFKLTVTDSKGISSTDNTTISVFEKVTWTVEGVTREVLVHPSSSNSGSAPVIMLFHGHGGTDIGFAEKGFELSWPQAVVVYVQGIREKTSVDPSGKKSGWQTSVGEVNSFTHVKDQDLKFFDAMLPTLHRKYNANLDLIFVHGWSNGGDFIYNVLWAARGKQLAGLSPAGANLSTTNGKRPIPVIHTAGTQDDKVSFSRQERCTQSVRSLNKCSNNGSTWATGPSALLGTKYASPMKDNVVFLQYNGSHRYPFTVPPIIVNFFKEIAKQ